VRRDVVRQESRTNGHLTCGQPKGSRRDSPAPSAFSCPPFSHPLDSIYYIRPSWFYLLYSTLPRPSLPLSPPSFPHYASRLTGCWCWGRIEPECPQLTLQLQSPNPWNLVMDDARNLQLPARSRSKRIRSAHPSSDPFRGHLATTASPSSPTTTPRAARPGLAARANSAPLVPLLSKDPEPLDAEPPLDVYVQRGSVTSIKDDPFFRNYQSPHGASLARELTSATHRADDLPIHLPPRSSKIPSVDSSVDAPVSTSSPFLIYS
jgi:hypothetical protein